MGPGGQDDGGGDGLDADLAEQRRGGAGLHELVHAGLVRGQLCVEAGDLLGQPDRLSACGRGADLLAVSGAPSADVTDLGAGQRLAGIDLKVNDTQQCRQRVDYGGPLGAHVVASSDQHRKAARTPWSVRG